MYSLFHAVAESSPTCPRAASGFHALFQSSERRGGGLVAIDAFPPRLDGETPWADPVLRWAVELRRETGVVVASVAMSPLAYGESAKAFTRRWRRLPFLQGHHAAAGAIRALLDHREVGARATRAMAPHRERTTARRALRGLAGPVDEALAARILPRYGVRRPKMLPSTYGLLICTVLPRLRKGEFQFRSMSDGVASSRRRPARLRAMSKRGLPVSCV